ATTPLRLIHFSRDVPGRWHPPDGGSDFVAVFGAYSSAAICCSVVSIYTSFDLCLTPQNHLKINDNYFHITPRPSLAAAASKSIRGIARCAVLTTGSST